MTNNTASKTDIDFNLMNDCLSLLDARIWVFDTGHTNHEVLVGLIVDEVLEFGSHEDRMVLIPNWHAWFDWINILLTFWSTVVYICIYRVENTK